MAICTLVAYPISRKDFAYRKMVNIMILITMFFNGGLVPSYILMTSYLHLKDNIWVLIIPLLYSAWHIILLRTFFAAIPFGVVESAMMDGASEFRSFLQIVLPLSKPAIATIGLFTALMYWNDWFTALLYIDSSEKYPLQYVLQKFINDIEAIKNLANSTSQVSINLDIPTESMRMAMVLVAAGPMMFVFPFFQKYFVKGITMGSLKG